MPFPYQLVKLRASQAGRFACFINRTGEPLGEWNRLWFSGFRSGKSRLRLFSSATLSSLHKLSCSQKTRPGESWLCVEQRQCEHLRAAAYGSARQRAFEDLWTLTTAREFFSRSGCEERPHDSGLSTPSMTPLALRGGRYAIIDRALQRDSWEQTATMVARSGNPKVIASFCIAKCNFAEQKPP